MLPVAHTCLLFGWWQQGWFSAVTLQQSVASKLTHRGRYIPDPTTVRRNVSGRASKENLTRTAPGHDYSFKHTAVATPRTVVGLGLERMKLENVHDVSSLSLSTLASHAPTTTRHCKTTTAR